MMIKRSQRHKISNLIDLFSTKNIESHKNIDATTSSNEYCQNNEVSDSIALQVFRDGKQGKQKK